MLCLQRKAHIRVGLCDQAPHWGAQCDQCDQRWRPHKMASRCLKSPPYGAGYLMKDSITGLLLFGAVSDGGYGGTCPHVSVESRSIKKAPGEATSTDKLEVKMLPHMAEGCVGVLVDSSAIRTKGKLPALPLDVERLPHEASVSVEVT